MTDDEFSSWFAHDGGPCPLTVGTICIRVAQKSIPGQPIQGFKDRQKVLEDSYRYIVVLGPIEDYSFDVPNAWEWRYFGTLSGGATTPKLLRYRVKKSPGVKLLEQIAKDPPIDLIPDPERKLLEYHPS